MHIAIVENESESARQLIDNLKLYEVQEKVSLIVDVYNNGMDFIEEYKPVYDVVFMDIEMPLMDGLTVTKKLREIDTEINIVFVTFLAQYASKGYEVDAIDYIVKPIKYANLVMVMRKVNSRMKNKQAFVTITTPAGIKRLNINDIVYLEAYNNHVKYVTDFGEYMVRIPLSNAEIPLLEHGFSRCHRGYTVNLRHVTDVNQNEVILKGVSLIISRHKRKEFLSALTEFWGGGAR